MRDVFVGYIVGIAVSHVACSGEALEDRAATSPASTRCCVAFVPTQLGAGPSLSSGRSRSGPTVVESLRVTIAAVLIVTAAFLVVEATTGHWDEHQEAQERRDTRSTFLVSTLSRSR